MGCTACGRLNPDTIWRPVFSRLSAPTAEKAELEFSQGGDHTDKTVQRKVSCGFKKHCLRFIGRKSKQAGGFFTKMKWVFRPKAPWLIRGRSRTIDSDRKLRTVWTDKLDRRI
jgi:hypothetical protein